MVTEILVFLSEYRALFLMGFELLLVFIMFMVLHSLFQHWKEEKQKADALGDKYRLGLDFSGSVGEVDRQNAIRQILAPDGVDPSPNTYMGMSDGGREVYVRSVTISKLPKRVKFAKTLKELFDFPDCTSTVFVYPEDNESVSRDIDRQINVTETEEIGSEGNTNRVRKLGTQKRKLIRWAEEVEDGEKKFFRVGFLFQFYADSVDKLNRITDDFRSVALGKKIDISNCYGAQSEAFLAGLPLNRHGNTIFKKIHSDCIKMFRLDQGAVSVVLNYTTDHFTHRSGVPVGRNLFTGQPYFHDIYAAFHLGFTHVLCGKTSSGKSALIKMLIERCVPLGYRFVIIDSQTRKGTSEGEYASSAEINGGVSYQISSRRKTILSLFDIQESIEYIKETESTGYERRTLELNSAITTIVYNLRTLIRGNLQMSRSYGEQELDAVMDSDINDILTQVVKELFAERGIVNGDADSLYEEGSVIINGELCSGIVPKELPTVTECYKKLILERASGRDRDRDAVYRFILNNIRENVRELYYTERGDFFTKEEFESLPVNPQKTSERLYGDERVMILKGIRPYFDGQSTFTISRDCPVTVIDISQLPEEERRPARDIALHIVDGGYVKKNSERMEKADKLVVLVDEAHESFSDPSARALLSNEVRTAAKRNVAMLFSTQTVEEFERYPETRDIFSQAAVKMIFKQDADKKKLAKQLNISESQANVIVNRLSTISDPDDPAEFARHRGEMCVIDTGNVTFVKVDFLRQTEALSVERDAAQVMQAMRVSSDRKVV